MFKHSDREYPWERVFGLWTDALTAANILQISNARKSLKQCKDVWELHHLHNTWAENASSHIERLENTNQPFPEPPIPGTSGIIPIKKVSELFLEGKEMRHCISIHSNDIYSGKRYAYRVLTPQRGTLMLYKRIDYWCIQEFRLDQNKSPSEESWSYVRKWYDQHSGSLSR